MHFLQRQDSVRSMQEAGRPSGRTSFYCPQPGRERSGYGLTGHVLRASSMSCSGLSKVEISIRL